jgi:hypothetical protein
MFELMHNCHFVGMKVNSLCGLTSRTLEIHMSSYVCHKDLRELS